MIITCCKLQCCAAAAAFASANPPKDEMPRHGMARAGQGALPQPVPCPSPFIGNTCTAAVQSIPVPGSYDTHYSVWLAREEQL